jgi:hypothetical protein
MGKGRGPSWLARWLMFWGGLACAPLVGGCGGGGGNAGGKGGRGDAAGDTAAIGGDGPPAGNPSGGCTVPADAQAADVSHPDTVIGDGSPAGCTGSAFVAAVAKGGVITFACGPDPVTIELTTTAKVVNTSTAVVIDGGGKVTLDGGGSVRILYQDTCDAAQTLTTSHCQDQPYPALTVQNVTFSNGNSTGEEQEGGGGGAILARGGRLKIINAHFFNNSCDSTGPDLGGAAVRVLSQYNDLPAYVVGSTFGGAKELGNSCSNGGAISSIGVSWTVLNSVMSFNRAIGEGANPARAGTPGGGSGGAVYNEGETITLTLCGDQITDNEANEGGGGVFFVSDDLTGTLVIKDSTLARNTSGRFETQGYPGIFFLGSGDPQVTSSTLSP